MNPRLPVSLENSPLIEAVFEIRFQPDETFPSRMLGVLLPKALQRKTIEFNAPFEQLDGLSIPKELKQHDLQLNYIPSFRLIYGDVGIAISNGSLVITQDDTYFPYKSWNIFKTYIIEILSILAEVKTISDYTRMSIKYFDLFDFKKFQSPINLLNLQAKLGETDLKRLIFDIKFEEKVNNDLITIITQVISSANLQMNLNNLVHTDKHNIQSRDGLILTTDVILDITKYKKDNQIDSEIFFNHNLENLHTICKQRFFSTLNNNEALNTLGAKYE